MLRVRRVLEIFLEMNESTRCLNEAFEKIVVIRIGVQPKLLEHIVRLIITLLVPALKKGAIKWMLCSAVMPATNREILSPLFMKGLICSRLR